MKTRAVCEIEHALLHQCTANILVAPPTLEREDAHAKECRIRVLSASQAALPNQSAIDRECIQVK
jgi:hypothetical protein